MQNDLTIPYGYCQCGCGEKTNIARCTVRKNGWVKGEPLRYVFNHHRRGRTYVVEDCGFTTPCWVWQGTRDTCGYGRIWRDGKQRTAHRYYYFLKHGGVPTGLELDHLCRNRACCNPDHMEPVTHGENVRRGRRCKIDYHGALLIRIAAASTSLSQSAIGEIVDLDQTTISDVLSGHTWPWPTRDK